MTDPASPPVPMPAVITSPAGYRTSGRTGRRTWHEGSDYRAPTGTPVLAVRPGRVHGVFREEDRRSRTRGYGNLVVLYHPREAVYTAYAHLSQILVAPALEVTAGTVLGASGSTSNGRFPRMPPHLHFAVRRSRRSGAAPWPGPYPHPQRHPALHREIWVDPAAFLARFGIETVGRRHGAGALRIRPGSHADAGHGWPATPRIATTSQGATARGATAGQLVMPGQIRERMDATHTAMNRFAGVIESRRDALGPRFVNLWRRLLASWLSFYFAHPPSRDLLYLGTGRPWQRILWYEARLRDWQQAVELASPLRSAS